MYGQGIPKDEKQTKIGTKHWGDSAALKMRRNIRRRNATKPKNFGSRAQAWTNRRPAELCRAAPTTTNKRPRRAAKEFRLTRPTHPRQGFLHNYYWHLFSYKGAGMQHFGTQIVTLLPLLQKSRHWIVQLIPKPVAEGRGQLIEYWSATEGICDAKSWFGWSDKEGPETCLSWNLMEAVS